MNIILKDLLVKFKQAQKEQDLVLIEQISNLLNNELYDLVKTELSTFTQSYEQLLDRGENMVSRGYKYEVKNSMFYIYSPHENKKEKYRKFFSVTELSSFLEDPKALTQDKKDLSLALLSNSNSVLCLNMAINLS